MNGADSDLRRVADEKEFAIPAEPDVINLAELTPQSPRHVSRGGTGRTGRRRDA